MLAAHASWEYGFTPGISRVSDHYLIVVEQTIGPNQNQNFPYEKAVPVRNWHCRENAIRDLSNSIHGITYADHPGEASSAH